MPPKVPERLPVYYLINKKVDHAVATGDLRRVAALESAGYQQVSVSDYMETYIGSAWRRYRKDTQ
jgi:hypothetical protein